MALFDDIFKGGNILTGLAMASVRRSSLRP